MRCVRQSTSRLWVAAAVFLGGISPSLADVQLPNIFSDHMVLQQGQKNRVWGRAAPNERVAVSLADQTYVTSADDQGMWRVLLEPLPPGGPYTLSVKGQNEIEIQDVLIGEVWICSGQSNMRWTVNGSNDADLERAAAHFPHIRMINFPNVGSQQPIWSHDERRWQVCSPETVGEWSAVGYFFARQLHQTLAVPVGMINNSWGGSACEAWINRELLARNTDFQPLLDRWEQMEKTFDELSRADQLDEDRKKQLAQLTNQMRGNSRPGNIYNGVLKSHLGYGIRGAIWYQGESNVQRAYQYRILFPLMIQSWREEWGQGDFPFYWVQLADFRREKLEPVESSWAELREAQTMTMKKLPQTGEAVIIDLGEGKDIHPKNKVDVGRRLARWALAETYKLPGIACRSPIYQSMEIQEGKIVLTFENVPPNANAWRPFDVSQPVGFAIAGPDREFVFASAKILPDGRIEVWSDLVRNPVAVRYAWADNPKCNMYSAEGLPLTPFRTDDWPGVTANAR